MKQFNAILAEERTEKELLEVKMDLKPVINEYESALSASVQPKIAPESVKPLAEPVMVEGDISVEQGPVIQLTRKQLYDEIWEKSVAGLARKLDIPYADLMQQVKEADIPVPPPGYWTQLRHGKPTMRPALSAPSDSVVSIHKAYQRTQEGIEKHLSSSNLIVSDSQVSSRGTPEGNETVHPQMTDTVATANIEGNVGRGPETYTSYGQTYNVYDRETLYKEVWEAPITEIAKRYGVSDVAIHKVCKALDIPKPSRGYWAKLRAGKSVTIKPLPKNDAVTQKTGVRTGSNSQRRTDKETLEFLSEEERELILAIASQASLPSKGTRKHPKINSHHQVIADWRKEEHNSERRGRGRTPAPTLAESVSDDTIHRVYRIIEALTRALEPLGCSLTDDLNFLVNGETVILSFSESTDKVPHVPTKEENMKLLKYEEDRKRYSWASKPQIRKYDYIFNGRLKVVIDGKRSFRDCQSYVLEDRLGDIMIELYEAAESIKKAREAREDAERSYQEELRRKEEWRQRYNLEVDRTLALTNLAEDYDTASKIRRYIAVLEQTKKSDEKMIEWIEWAKCYVSI